MKIKLLLFLVFINLLFAVTIGQSQNTFTNIGIKNASTSKDNTLPEEELKYNVTDNFVEITTPASYNKTIASNTVPKEYQVNSDFGFMPFGTDIKDVYEEIQKRTADERCFRNQSNPSEFYIQKASSPINYFKNGAWLAIDPRLKKIDNKHYAASQQPLKCELDITKQKTVMDDGNQKFGFNHFTMVEYNTNGTSQSYSANWQNYTVGDNGISIQNVFPGIDMVIKFSEHTIKSNFILLHSRPVSSHIVFTDLLDLPDGYKVAVKNANKEEHGFNGNLSINDKDNREQYIYGKINITDNAHANLFLNGYYTFSANTVNINVYNDVYNNAGITYPLIIDPIVTYGAFNGTANSIGAGISPATCSTTITASIPGGTTCTDFSATWLVANTNNTCGCVGAQNCRLVKDQVYLTSSCGGVTPVGAPATVWACPGCNTFGTWNPTIPYASSGTASMATCITPQCAAQNITFTIFLNQFGCTGATCGSCTYATNTCAHLNSWSVTIQAHSLEVLGNVAGNGSSTVTGSCGVNSTLNPTALYGVPAYTYSWNPGGAITSTITVNQSVDTSYNIVATVTDACGVVRTATFTFTVSNCPLPIELLSFDADYNGKSVDTKWTTATETNNDFFTVERTTDGINYIVIGKVPSKAPGGNSITNLSYTLNDPNVTTGTYYYRLRQTDYDGVSKLSNIVPVTISEDNDSFEVIPNPANNTADIYYQANDFTPSILKIIDAEGKEVYVEQIEGSKGRTKHTINLSSLSNGIYFISLNTNIKNYNVKLVKQ